MPSGLPLIFRCILTPFISSICFTCCSILMHSASYASDHQGMQNLTQILRYAVCLLKTQTPAGTSIHFSTQLQQASNASFTCITTSRRIRRRILQALPCANHGNRVQTSTKSEPPSLQLPLSEMGFIMLMQVCSAPLLPCQLLLMTGLPTQRSLAQISSLHHPLTEPHHQVLLTIRSTHMPAHLTPNQVSDLCMYGRHIRSCM